LIKPGGKKISYEIRKLVISIWNKEELPEEWKESILNPINKNGDKTDFVVIAYKILSKILLPILTPYADKIIGDQLRIIYSSFVKYLRKNVNKRSRMEKGRLPKKL